MGLFSKFMGGSKEPEQPSKGLKYLLEIELQEGEFTLPDKLWGHLSRYTLRLDDDVLWLNGDSNFEVSSLIQIIDEFAAKFGTDGLGEGNWTSQDSEDLESFGSINRTWYFDENFNGKPSEWVMDKSNNYDYSKIVRVDGDNEEGIEMQFIGWTMIKNYLKSM